MMSDIRVLPVDLPHAGLCVSAARTWFTAHGLDFRAFLREGVPIDVARATGCPLAERACVAAERRVREAENGE